MIAMSKMAVTISLRGAAQMFRPLLIGTTLFMAVPATAQMMQPTQDARTGATLNVPINKSQTLRVGQTFAKAVIGNSDIADVLPVSTSSVYVLGRAIGSTNLSLYDKSGRLIAVVDIVIGPDAQGLKAKLAELMPTEAIAVTASNGSLVLSGTATSASAVERIVTIAETYAPKAVVNMLGVGSVQQVLLEVKFSEMSRGTVKQLGINQVSFISNSGTSGGINTAFDVANSPFQLGLSLPSASNLLLNINALERQGLVRTLAEPNLVALSGETASFLAGGEFPVPIGVTIQGQVQIEFKQFGVSLSFTPTVLDDGVINLLVGPEVSSLDPAAGIELQGLRIPGLKVRRARTTVELRDGQSFALAGLIQSDFADTVRGIPLLGRIPIIGALFRSTSYTKNETELVMIVTPRLVRPVAAGSFAVPTDRVLEPSDMDMFFKGKSEKRVTPGAPGLTSASQSGAGPTAPDGQFGHVVR